MIGGFGATHHLRQSLTYLNMPTMQQPEAYLASLGDAFDPSGLLTNPKTTDLLTKFTAAFATWIQQNAKK